MKIQESKFEFQYSDKILALPFSDAENSKLYSSDAINCIKFLRNKLDIEFYANPDELWEQRSIDWLGPTLLITGQLLSDNPNILNILFDTLRDYIGGKTLSRDKTAIKMKVICKKDKDSKSLDIEYEGDLKGLDKFKDAIESVLKD